MTKRTINFDGGLWSAPGATLPDRTSRLSGADGFDLAVGWLFLLIFFAFAASMLYVMATIDLRAADVVETVCFLDPNWGVEPTVECADVKQFSQNELEE